MFVLDSETPKHSVLISYELEADVILRLSFLRIFASVLLFKMFYIFYEYLNVLLHGRLLFFLLDSHFSRSFMFSVSIAVLLLQSVNNEITKVSRFQKWLFRYFLCPPRFVYTPVQHY